MSWIDTRRLQPRRIALRWLGMLAVALCAGLLSGCIFIDDDDDDCCCHPEPLPRNETKHHDGWRR